MAAPNIVNVTEIYGKTVSAAVTTSLAAVLTNAASSGKVLKVNTILCANIDGANDATVRIAYSDNGTTRYIAYNLDVIAQTTLVVLSKDQAIYLEENDSLSALASANGDVDIVISYEEITDV